MKKLSVVALSLLLAANGFAQTNQTFKGTVNNNDATSYKSDQSYSPQWETIKESDIAWRKRVWRTVDLSNPENKMLQLTSLHPSVGDVLLNGLFSGEFKQRTVYADDRFTVEFTPEMIAALMVSGTKGERVTSLKIKEDWIGVMGENKTVVRIVGLCPVVDGKELFWVYYPETREYLAKQLIAAPGTEPSNLDQVFEGRFFNSKVDRMIEQPVVHPDPAKKW